MNGLGSADILDFAGFRLHLRDLRLEREGGGAVKLGRRAREVLKKLLEGYPDIVGRRTLLDEFWPKSANSNLDIQIQHLREVIDPARNIIETVYGEGFRIVVPVKRVASTLLRPRLSIVVLPFANLSDDPAQQFFADGITDDLTTDLSRLPDMFVISRQTAFSYRDKPIDTKQIGRELGVHYVLEGSVRRAGGRVRVNAQLINAYTDAHLWADRFDRSQSELLQLQDEITTAIAGAVEPEMLKFERNRVGSNPQHNEDAYVLYQRGMWHLYKYGKEDEIEAQAFFRRALAIDPQYPQATAFLAITVCNAAYLGWVDDVERNYAEAYELAERAVALESQYPASHLALGLACMWTSRSEQAIAELHEAIGLNPSYAAAHVLLGQMHLYRGEPEKALAFAEKGIRLSPRDPRLFMWLPALAGAHYQLRQYDKAVEIGRRSWSLNRNWPAGLRYAVAGLAQLGKGEKAQSLLDKLRLLNPDLAFVEGNLQRLFSDSTAVDHILEGLRKAGF